MTDTVRVRFAPSPTGTLHLGGARTAIYNWAFARRMGGTFVLRIDDTDAQRSTPENTAQILTALRWLGLDWDEGPEAGGDFGPYFQTQRFGKYLAALNTMIERDGAYPCFCTAEELAEKRDASRIKGGFSGYDRTCRSLTKDEAAARIDAGEPHVWRLKVPDNRESVIVNDIVRGETEFPMSSLDDFVLARTDGSPTYNFASVIDDGDMRITHIIRGDDHLANTPRQILVFEALGWDVPEFAHLSMIWGEDGKKLSKRHGATGVEEYASLGYLPNALLNYLALLGWSLDGETTIVSPETLKANFSLDRISKNPAIFDIKKLEWINGVYLRETGAEEFVEIMVERLQEAGFDVREDYALRPDWYYELAPLVSERIKLTTEIVPLVSFFFTEEFEIDEAARTKVLAKAGSKESLELAATLLADCDWDTVSIDGALHTMPDTLGLKPRVVFQALRVAVTGTTISPPLFESMALLGREKTLNRIKTAAASLLDIG